jgi:hypothetical protein
MPKTPRMKMSDHCKHAQHSKCESPECWCVCHPPDALLQSSEGPHETNDHSAALLPVDPSAAVSTEALPISDDDWFQLNYENPDVLRSGLWHLRYRIEKNLQVPHYRDYHLEVIDAALKLVGSGNQSLSEASPLNAQERERKNTHPQPAAEGRETPDLHEAKDAIVRDWFTGDFSKADLEARLDALIEAAHGPAEPR